MDILKRKSTLVILGLNLLLFIIMELIGSSTNTATLIQFGAMFKPFVQMGQWWRLITPIFLHIGFTHLLMNSYSLFILGQLFETLYGSVKFVIIYLLSGIMGNLAGFAFSSDLTVSAGASTSIYGLFGLGIAMIAFYREDEFLRQFGKSFAVLLVINLVYSAIIPGIDMLGHLGGLLGGFLLGGILPVENRKLSKSTKIIGVVLFIGIATLLYSKGMNYI